MLWLAKPHAVIAQHEAEIDRDAHPLRRAMPAAGNAKEHVTTVPRDAFVILLALAALARAEIFMLLSPHKSDAARRDQFTKSALR